jgi:hypothetical protein
VRRLLTFGGACVVALAIAPSASAHYSNPGAQKCGGLSFQENTDSGAEDLRARRTSCVIARRLVLRETFSDASHPFGYTCRTRGGTGRSDRQSGLTHADVRCAKNYRTDDGRELKKVVTWAVS